MRRRTFLHTGLAAGAAWAWTGTTSPMMPAAPADSHRGRLKLAPHFGMFRHHAGDCPLDQLRWLAGHGFTAVEDRGLAMRPTAEQARIGREANRLGLTLGLFVATADYAHPTFAAGRRDLCDRVLRDVERAMTVARRVDARWCAIVPGRRDDRLPWRRQFGHVVDLLRRCAERAERSGRVLLLEPTHPGRDDSRMVLRTLPQAAALCRAVGSPACRVLFDVYSEYQRGAEPVASLTRWWDHIGYVQLADAPGRKEPGTGRVDCRGLLRRLCDLGYDGPVGMDHGRSLPGRRGEQAVLAAYAAFDPAALAANDPG